MKIKIATRYSNMVSKITKFFRVSEKDLNTGLKVWRTELDFEVPATYVGITNNYLLGRDGKPYKVYEYDLSKIERLDGNAADNVSTEEFLRALIECTGKRFIRGEVKIIFDEAIKPELVKLRKESVIGSDKCVISDVILSKQEIKLIPDLGVNISDDKINSMQDIKNIVKSKAKETTQDLEVKLEG